ncbi:hypothetical protein CN13_00355 [Petrotoga sp. HKA.pet.4.5]|uniref:hypothetical protein n=1 Tax=unclassified Petrotoga TaxID=2620614 RepID=UPI000EF151D6|nr:MULTISPECIES: hypothetical protein [unclassified Petrotoga]RLL83261.1 hypothetical protein BZ25_07290 [Petrotoga sp. Shatin.DS.tank11.9.2.9.3]RLL90606.1 hypothetical protein CN13_00355 [Petrotoga sp. HKA.pet.4.5]
MKKVLLSLLVVFSALALFALEPVYDVSGTAGFEFKMDESALDIESVLDYDVSMDISFTTTLPATLTAGFTFSPVTVTKDASGYVTDVSPALSLNYVQSEQEAWLLRFEPNVIGLSNYTMSGFTTGVGSLKLGLTDYGVNVVLADRVAGDVTEHATGDFAIPANWILGASYDLDVSGVKGLVAGAFKFVDATNNRVTVEGKVTEVPVPGELSADLVFGMLNFDDSGAASSATAYRVDAAYEYPYKMEPITVTPHVGFTWQNNLGTVYAEEVTNGADFSVADTQAVTAGADLSYLADPLTVDLTDTLTINLLEATPVYSLALTPAVDYAISDLSSAGVEVPVTIADLTDFASTLSITPHGYLTYGVTEVPVTLGADVYYFFEDGEQAANPIAYIANVSYAFTDNVSAGAHLGNETLDADGNLVGAAELTDLHWYLYLKAEFEF